jgi:hypothetical protein
MRANCGEHFKFAVCRKAYINRLLRNDFAPAIPLSEGDGLAYGRRKASEFGFVANVGPFATGGLGIERIESKRKTGTARTAPMPTEPMPSKVPKNDRRLMMITSLFAPAS